MIHKIIEDKNLLRQKSQTVKITKQDICLANDLKQTLKATFNTSNAGVAIACPQIGVYKKIIVVDESFLNSEGKMVEKFLTCFNPSIVQKKGKQTYWEGCLSSPLETGKVERPYSITIKYQNEEGRMVFAKKSGFDAIVFCHEIDHLKGIIYQDKAIKTVVHKSQQDKIEFRNQIQKTDPLTVICKE